MDGVQLRPIPLCGWHATLAATDSWLNLQSAYNLRSAKQKLLPVIDREIIPRQAA